MENFRLITGIAIGVFVLTELIWAFTQKKKVYDGKDILANVFIAIGGRIIKPIALTWSGWIFSLVEPYQFYTIPMNAFTFLIAFLLVELIYYWYHRWSHEIPFLWAIHHTHHSSQKLNVFTAPRLNWLGKFTSPLFYLPLIFIGFQSIQLVVLLALSLFYQVFLHTEMIKKLGFLEGFFLNTPSAHRVHHASNEQYIDRNYGGTLIIYDKLFGTYTPEGERPVYGVTTGHMGYNPFVLLFKPMLDLFKIGKLHK